MREKDPEFIHEWLSLAATLCEIKVLSTHTNLVLIDQRVKGQIV